MSDHPIALSGVRDYRVTLPMHRADNSERAELRVRIPATDPGSAQFVGEEIVDSLVTGLNLRAGGEPGDSKAGWRYGSIPDPEDVDDQPDIEMISEMCRQAQAEAAHYKRIAAAFAGKFGILAQLTADEYRAVEPDDLESVPAPGDYPPGQRPMMFLLPVAGGAAVGLEPHEPAAEVQVEAGRQLQIRDPRWKAF